MDHAAALHLLETCTLCAGATGLVPGVLVVLGRRRERSRVKKQLNDIGIPSFYFASGGGEEKSRLKSIGWILADPIQLFERWDSRGSN